MRNRTIAFWIMSLFSIQGCNPKLEERDPVAKSPTPIPMQNVQHDIQNSKDSIAEYSVQNKEALMKQISTQLQKMDLEMNKLRDREHQLANDAKSHWEASMLDLDTKRKAAGVKLAALELATAEAWGEVEKGAALAWEDLNVAFQKASREFESHED